MDVSLVTAALRRWWLVILASTWAAGAIVGVFTATQPPAYTATAQGIVSVSNPDTRPPYALSSGAQYILDRMTSYANLGVTTPVLQRVIDDLGLDETAETLSGHIDSHSIVGKAVLEVAVTYDDPKTAAAVADSVLAGVSEAVAQVERGNVQLVELGAATPPTSPSNQKVVINTAVAAAGGLVFGCFLAVGLQMLARSRSRRGARDG